MTKIDDKWQQLKAHGLDLGAPVGAESDAGFGGTVRQYQNGRIYWHAVMGAEAHEVHGGILDRYLAMGAQGVNPNGGERCFGFPLSDETVTPDGLYPVSYFETGVIFWREFAGPIFGPFYAEWHDQQGAETGSLGYSISEVTAFSNNRIQYYERGLLYSAGGARPFTARYVGPQIGQPALVPPSAAGVDLALYAGPVAEFGHGLLAQALEDRLFLREVNAAGAPRAEIALACTSTDDASTSTLHAKPATDLRERTLYDLCFRRPDGGVVVIANHAVFAKSDWTHFGFAHITDLHLARRNDTFPDQFAAKGIAVSDYNNFNDAFRDFVRSANRLHDSGQLDLILATGDLVDFVYEDDDNQGGAGNWGFFEDLLLGRARYPKRADAVEELRVPIFTSLGNHDYRQHPYPLACAIETDGTVGIELTTLENFDKFNLTHDQTFAFMGVNTKVPTGVVQTWPGYTPGGAGRFVQIDPGMHEKTSYYFRHLNRDNSYVVRIGIHRFAMLDSRWDAGIVTDLGTAILAYLGFTDKRRQAFIGGAPQSEGCDPDDLASARTAVTEAGTASIVIIGVHAPLFEIAGSEYGHYFRETERPKLPNLDEVRGFAFRRLGAKAPTPGDVNGMSQFEILFSDWMVPSKPYFKKGGIEPMLNAVVGLGQGEELMNLCLGSAGRRVDLVLFGHVHHNVEYAMGREPTGERTYFHDYYSQNPDHYYPSTHAPQFFTSQDLWVQVSPTPIDKAFTPPGTTDAIVVPPYAETLDTVEERKQDVADWWHDHRPLLIQTAALGPLENPQQTGDGSRAKPTFQGFRVLLVDNNAIHKIQYVLRTEILDPTKPLAWEPVPVKAPPPAPIQRPHLPR